jgi:phosphoglycerol transferase MdoB-like AlkP superfamily enzyme
VPCWGANTIRSELAVLAGLGSEDVGLDRYNPYEHFALVPLPTLASQAHAAGYRTICLHPYQRDFYARDRVMPMLGFDEFIGLDGFADAATFGPYVGDAAVAERAAALVREHGPKVLVFCITMENHGPWDASHDGVPPTPLPAEWAGEKDAAAIGRWLTHLRSADAMIPVLRDAIGARGWLLFYGDHQPSLAGAFRAPGAGDRRTDYALWTPGRGEGARVDRAAEDLAAALLAATCPTKP